MVLHLQRSLPALRQMTPDSEAFIQQSLLPQPSTQPAAAASTALTAVVLRPPLSTATTAATSTAVTKTTVISLTQTPQSKPGAVILLLMRIITSFCDQHIHTNGNILFQLFLLVLLFCVSHWLSLNVRRLYHSNRE